MPFTIDDQWRIMRLLQIDSREESVIKPLLEIVQDRSESLVQHTLKIAAQMEETEAELAKASKGMIRLDVIEWKEDRRCDLNQYLTKLRFDLARSIGYPLQQFLPF